ncbi:protein Njmu-R1 isoform X2 [Falco biarmicus]|uniref:protein Njmu-R1 isoform X2 n=1 Tax=Falco rusticolus TaxID=120794 RepID=UPI0018867315|nr:protein Njmu-R1 isoform X2 [Falco rusticolus]XP_040437883.1 protein Njmu-R1 isoform X2 [Falco naumanni]XP_055582876.1 protein Njmu-R1 isoform X2 [Falco cherrug]XP_055650149.1 protein Njmu-R1 isoform X2 [Falco peregrinus]XP_056197850.1 protein Njmu-R1 isoform X2 [Falco biarmicus]
MLPALPDGDERELESSEEGGGAGEERRPERHGSTYHSLYSYRSCSLSLLDTNLPSEAETELRSFIAKRLTKGALFEGMGNVVSVGLSIPEYKVGCYYCRFQQENLEMATLESDINAPEYVVCFLGGSEKGLELFRLELDKYIRSLKINLDLEQNPWETYVNPYLRSWFENAICPIQRVVQLFQEKLAFLLHAALSYTPVEVKNADERTEKDISRFLAAASLQGLVQEGTMTSLCIAMTEEQHKSMIIDCSGPQPQLHNAASNRFCEDWMQAFVNGAEGGNPFLFRQILENFKLKAIQDINNLKRYIRQAEMNHYALFKCYMFLKNCGSGDILLKIVKVEHAEMPEARNVVTVLEEFMRETSVA